MSSSINPQGKALRHPQAILAVLLTIVVTLAACVPNQTPVQPTSIPPTTMLVPPTFTPLPPTLTLTPSPTLTLIPPTATLIPPTFTPLPPTAMPTHISTGSGSDLGRIAYYSDSGGDWEIMVMNADGSERIELTKNTSNEGQPTWSSDGNKIAYFSDRDGNLDIYAMNANGSQQTQLTNNPAVEMSPAWSPDGKQIAFSSNRDGNFEIYRMNADGSGQTRLTNTESGEDMAAWSPDGQQIAFVSTRDDQVEIYLMNADGSEPTRLTNSPTYDIDPDWSPDGMQIAFSSDRDGNSEIYRMNADGSGQTRLTDNDAYDDMPAWSPDGKQIAFYSTRDGQDEIYVMNADGSEQTRLTNNSAMDNGPVWQPVVSNMSPQANYDGTYDGTTSQGEKLMMVIENNGVRSISVGFDIPGDCAGSYYSPLNISFGQPKGLIEANTLKLAEKPSIVITGTFTTATEISGTMVINPVLCGGTAAVTWSASSNFTPSAAVLVQLIPELEIPSGLFLSETGSSNVSEYADVLYAQGDWMLVKDFRSIIPIPSGWTYDMTDSGTQIDFSPDNNPESQSILIFLNSMDTSANQTTEELMLTLETGVQEIPGDIEILQQEIVGPGKGYIFFTRTLDTGLIRNGLVLFSRNAQSTSLYRFVVFTDIEDWENYYPIIRAMVDHWVDWDLNPLGIALPDSLSK